MQAIKRFIKKYASHLLYRKQLKRQTYLNLLDKISKVSGLPLSSAADNIFTYHGEDGIIQFILQHLKNIPSTFVDIGSGDCIKSNCATLAVHRNWKGIFVDANKEQLAIGKRFYKRLGKKDLVFKNALVEPTNINFIVREAGYLGSVGLLSIDIDGNDYWIWDAIDAIQPLIVVIEAKVEFGMKNVLVPYSQRNHHRFNKEYNGASVEALRRLGLKKGYTLIGANLYGYNLFFIPTHLVKPPFNAVDSKSLLEYPDTKNSFYPEPFFQANHFVTG